MKRRSLLIVAALVLAATSLVPAAVSDPVSLDTGLIAGVPGSSPGVRVFKGVPFAGPPVGNLRWRAPQPPVKWSGVPTFALHFQGCRQ